MDRNVISIGKQLEKLIGEPSLNEERALDLLQALRGIQITVEGLKKSHIGKYVNTLRKGTSNDQVKSLAKKLISAWKKQLEAENSSEVARVRARSSESTPKGSPKLASTPSELKADTLLQSTPPPPPPPKIKEEGIKVKHVLPAVSFTSDDIRKKSRDLILTALTKGNEAKMVGISHDQIQQIAGVLEDCVFEEAGDTNQNYKKAIRSRVANLRDDKNPGLRQRVLIGEISPQKLATMSPLEMASDEMKKLRKEFTKETIRESQMAVQSGTKTDLLKCGKCKQSNCSYNQVQTRSADEPMTTFVLCNECGNRWKFN